MSLNAVCQTIRNKAEHVVARFQEAAAHVTIENVKTVAFKVFKFVIPFLAGFAAAGVVGFVGGFIGTAVCYFLPIAANSLSQFTLGMLQGVFILVAIKVSHVVSACVAEFIDTHIQPHVFARPQVEAIALNF